MKSFFILLVVITAGLQSALASQNYLLVHGAFQDSSIWETVQKELVDAGKNVVVVDLPGRNASGEAAKGVTLDDYVKTVSNAVLALNEPVILVGHSFAGMTITAVADQLPDNVDQVVYLAAYVPKSGESMEKLAVADKDNQFTQETFVVSSDYSYASILQEDQVRVFAQDANEQQAQKLKASMIREPLGPIGTPLEFSGDGLSSVKKVFIRTLSDGTVSTALQTRMIERAAIKSVYDIPSGHAPYLTQPEILSDLLLQLSGEQ